MTTEPKLMIAIQIESDIKTFTNWLLNYYERFPVNIAIEGELIEGIFVDGYFQHLPGGHSGLHHFRLFTEIKGLRPSDLMIKTDENWIMEIEELSKGKVPIGSVRVERVNNNSINAFFWSTVLGGYLKAEYKRIFDAICKDFFLNRPPKNMIDENIQPGKPETAPPGSESDIYLQHLSETEVDIRLNDVKMMKNFHKDYNPNTARLIYENIPTAWNKCGSEYRQWSSMYIAEFCGFRAETIIRYLRAFYCAGLRDFCFEGDWFSIPYHPRKPCPEITS